MRYDDVERFVDKHEIAIEAFALQHHWVSLVPVSERWALKEFHPGEKVADYEDQILFASDEPARKALLKAMLDHSQTGIAF